MEEARVQAPVPFDFRVAPRFRYRRCFRRIQFAAMTFRCASPSLATEPPHGPGAVRPGIVPGEHAIPFVPAQVRPPAAQVPDAGCAGKTTETTTCNLDK